MDLDTRRRCAVAHRTRRHAVILSGALIAIPRGIDAAMALVVDSHVRICSDCRGLWRDWVSPDGLFAVFVGLWAFIAGIALFTNQTTVDAALPYPALCVDQMGEHMCRYVRRRSSRYFRGYGGRGALVSKDQREGA